ncbi:branched-chain amino acid transport system substrate-binding protein [uncultured Gammaproteobacteria bacterium]
MMLSRRSLMAGLGFFSALIAVPLLAISAAQAAESIRIGSVLSVTGGASFLGDPEKKVLELIVEQINKAGGVKVGGESRKLDLIVYDDAGAADKAASFAKRLIDSDQVDLIIGGSTTATTMAVIPLAEKASMPFISLAGAVVIIEPVKKWVFKTPHTDRLAAEKVFADMKKRGITKVGLISEDAGFGKSGREQSLAIAAEYGIEIVADEVYSPKDPDTTAQLTKIKGVPGLQAVFNFGFGQGPAVVTRNFRQLGLSVPLYQSHGVASKEFIRLVGSASEGVRLPAAGLVVAEQLAAGDAQKPVVISFKKTYEDAFKGDVSTFAGHAFDALNIALGAIGRAGSLDKAKVRDEIEKTKGFIGTAGMVTMTPADHMGLRPDAFHMVEIRNGDWALLD